jgi:predicted dehydrogenase
MTSLKTKIYGAGSIGNHLANAARTLGWDVTVCDTDPAALARMREQIYPGRYGRWDAAIRQCTPADEPVGGFDLILVGTPPESHLPLAMKAIAERPRAVQIEKPLCPPSLAGMAELTRAAQGGGVKVFVGYDHVVGKAARRVEALVAEGAVGRLETLDVEFREHWAGIFAAHPWLAGPEDTYLGYTERGGGASGEHSHALNLWQHFAHLNKAGRVVAVDARLRMRTHGKARYDDLCALHLETESGLVGRVVQDVVTRPSRKWARLQGEAGAVELHIGGRPEGDVVARLLPLEAPRQEVIAKKRPDDFIEELRHIADHLVPGAPPSPIGLERAADTMLVLAAAHRSQADGRRVRIDYAKGHTPEALS